MKILHLEDNALDAELARGVLAAEFPGCAIATVVTRGDFLAQLAAEPPDLVLSDFSMPAFNGLEALALLRERAPHLPFVFFSGTIGEERAIEAVRAGANDYVTKDRMQRLGVAVRRALDDGLQRKALATAQDRVLELIGFIDKARDAIVVTDLDGRILFWNGGAERIYGWTAAEAVGRLNVELFPAEAHAAIRRAREESIAKGEWRGELSLRHKLGRPLVMEVSVSLIRDDAGRPKARLVIATDITETKKIEEQFLRAQRLESIGLLAAGIAHDFNNVLAPMLMAAPLLRQRATDPGDIRVLDILEKSTERGAGLVRQILGFARGASGGFQLTQVKHLLRDVGEVIQASFPKSITFDEDVSGDLWPIQANPTQIHQVVLNLAVNARDAMLPRGGTLSLRAENRVVDESAALTLEGARPGPFLVLEVADTGAGMAPEVLARIWEPFFTTKGEGKGTGLGLSTVRGIAVAHGGFVCVETEVGHGTTFRVFLPAAKPVGEEKRLGAVPTPLRGGGELILLVDDESAVRDLAATILTRHGYRVIGCSDGVEAIGLFTEHCAEIKLVISDLNMPNLDGAALALVLRRLQPDVKIVAVTGLGSPSDFGSPESAAFAAKLSKPFAAEELLTAVHRILRAGPSPV